MTPQGFPEKEQLQLTDQGWLLYGGSIKYPQPVSVVIAYEALGYDQAVLDQTRRLCGALRLRKPQSRQQKQLLVELRAGLARARELKRAKGLG